MAFRNSVTFKCCICGKENYGEGHNALGACTILENGEVLDLAFGRTERCCDACNENVVIPSRVYKLFKTHEQAKKDKERLPK